MRGKNHCSHKVTKLTKKGWMNDSNLSVFVLSCENRFVPRRVEFAFSLCYH
jgi:hypothetical protein